MRYRSISQTFCVLMSVGLLWGCAADIEPTPGPDAGVSSSLIQVELDGEHTAVEVNASDYDNWVHLDMDTGAEVVPANPADDLVWDLRFQRYKIQSNGGVSGAASVVVGRVRTTDYDAIVEAPTIRYYEDAEDSDDEDQDVDNPFIGATNWYNYDGSDHTLSPADFVFIVRSSQGTYYKLQMTGYYSSLASTSGYPSFRYAPIAAPTGDPALIDQLVVDVSSGDQWVYIDAAERAVLSLDEPSSSQDWDLAIKQTQIKTNSGTSGSGLGGARLIQGTVWDDFAGVDSVGFTVDEQLPASEAAGTEPFSGHAELNTWYDVEDLSPREQVYALRTADGEYIKLQVLAYQDGSMTLRLDQLTRELSVHQQTLAGAGPDQWVHFDLDSGAVVELENPAENTVWDLAISQTRTRQIVRMRTNGGTSGSGEAGAFDPELTELAEVTRVPAGQGCYLPAQGHYCDCEFTEQRCAQQSGVWTEACGCPVAFVVDELLPAAPGSEPYSGNSVLASWFDYDVETHEVSPKDAAYIVRTATGSYAKIKITNSADDGLTFDWVYAGPGTTRF